jgi:hypothetical protein
MTDRRYFFNEDDANDFIKRFGIEKYDKYILIEFETASLK